MYDAIEWLFAKLIVKRHL